MTEPQKYGNNPRKYRTAMGSGRASAAAGFFGSVYIFRRQDKNMWNKKKRVIKRYIKNYRENERKYLHKSICNCTA